MRRTFFSFSALCAFLILNLIIALPLSSKAASIDKFIQQAEGGSPKSQVNLGQIYEGGRGVKKDLSKAFYWYERAAQQGYAKK